ncbi:MAG: TVP38/TMEM64 family protein [Phycisphaerae bacterium]
MTNANKMKIMSTQWLLRLLQIISLLAIVACIVTIVHMIPAGASIARWRGWLAGAGRGGIGITAFIIIYIVATVLLVPGTALALVAGVLYGPWWGTLIVSVGATLGATMAYLLGRCAFRSAVERATAKNPKFAAIDRAIGKNGWKILALLRLSPVVPFSLSNYFFGTTSIRFTPYVLVTWICMPPRKVLYVYLGYAASQAAEFGKVKFNDWRHWTLLGVGLLLLVAASIYITKLTKRAVTEESEVTDLKASTKTTAPTVSSRSHRPLILALLAVVMLVLTVCIWFNRGPITVWLGPPR